MSEGIELGNAGLPGNYRCNGGVLTNNVHWEHSKGEQRFRRCAAPTLKDVEKPHHLHSYDFFRVARNSQRIAPADELQARVVLHFVA
jgi:hypothetical protein